MGFIFFLIFFVFIFLIFRKSKIPITKVEIKHIDVAQEIVDDLLLDLER